MTTLDLDLMSKIFLVGSQEALAEAAMFIRRSDEPFGLTSPGILEVGPAAPGLYLFEGHFGGMTVGAHAFCKAISMQFPNIVVGASVLDLNFTGVRSDQCLWGVVAYLNGTWVLPKLTGSSPNNLPPDIIAQVDNMSSGGALPRTSLPRLHQFALDQTLKAFTSDTVLCAPRVRDWSALTLAVAARGIEGLRQLNGPQMAKKLIMDTKNDRIFNVASWVDALMFGSRDSGKTGVEPYSDSEVATWPERHLGLLRLLGTEEGETGDLSRALLKALSSHKVSLQSGEHPSTWLVTFTVPAEDVQATSGMRRLIDNVGTCIMAGEFTELQRAHSISATVKAGYTGESLRLAMKMGMSPGLLASRFLPMISAPTGEKLAITYKLVAGFQGIYGSIKDFPDELKRAFTDGSDTIAHAFHALQTKEIMGDVIATAASEKPAPVATKRKRLAV